ncbi:MAG: glycosyltransferase family protein, partial [Bacteroidota bacterium]
HPDITIHCFWDKKEAPETLKAAENLTFHRLNDKKFLHYLASCRGYLSTAGFESICEAMYLGKPVLMIPVEGHYEQSCNALDATNSGAGIQNDVFDLDVLLNYLPYHQGDTSTFKKWCDQAAPVFLSLLK